MVSNSMTTQTLPKKLAGALMGTNAGLGSLHFIAVLGLGLALRLMDIKRAFYGYHMWNEAYYVTIARNFDHFGFFNLFNYDWRGGSLLSQRHGPSPFVPWLVYISSEIFGKTELAARLPILVLGIFSLAALYFIARELYDAEIALIAVFLAAIMPGVVFISRQVSLDGPMVAFGLASIWALLLAKRKRRFVWILVSSLLLGIAIFTKLTAVLFVPVLAWIWLEMILRGDFPWKWFRWLLPAAYFLIAVLPVLAWMAKGILTSSGASAIGNSGDSYLLRTSEWWSLRSWWWAAQATWIRLGEQIGHMLWYPIVLVVALSLTTRRFVGFIKQHAVVLLLILPWFAQMIYPISWYQNDGYTYPVLYGAAILLALVIRQAVRLARQQFQPSDGKMFFSISLLVLVIFLSSLWDYRQYYRTWYTAMYSSEWIFQRPANLVLPYDPLVSARMVRSLNTSHASILADNPATLFYAQDDYWQGKATWYWWGLWGERDELVRAIKSREYTYVVFTYQPPMEVVSALYDNSYKHLDLGVWKKDGIP